MIIGSVPVIVSIQVSDLRSRNTRAPMWGRLERAPARVPRLTEHPGIGMKSDKRVGYKFHGALLPARWVRSRTFPRTTPSSGEASQEVVKEGRDAVPTHSGRTSHRETSR
jgi:hypothetical protein